MSTAVLPTRPAQQNNCGNTPMIIKTWDEAQELFAKHLTPVKTTPKGWPVYAIEDVDELVEKLNVRLPEEF